MQDYFVHETAEVSKGAVIGKNTKIWHQSQIREGAKIGENCIISKCVYIDFDVLIGNNVKIQNGVSVYHGVEVEDDVFLGPHMTFTNDLYPRAFNSNWELVKTLVKRGASIGANATIICGITIGEYAMVGSGAVVTKSVPDYGLVFGNPAKLKGFVCKCGRKAVRIGKHNHKILMECTFCKTTFSIKEEDYLLLEED
ncbi:MAG TPA: acyltransferase [Methanofastidiosum sp.]|nr:acyltransferase [Methanofastidiosum sp.]HPA48509.1 acyltransferase [Methanofastidiosum sp.]HQK62798.1 acyltransferase [Methanofastidiosum sp.]HQM94522.1 acyltransferase [Methanofastidiosum sp.]HQQ48871.1 acyltransferase [Methanofastidiosum sp.]